MSSVDSFYELVERGRKGENSSLPFGLPRMEQYIEGFTQGTSYLCAASSGVGKTTFVLYSFIYRPIMANETVKDVHYIYFNLEMTEEQILAKLLSIYIYETYGEHLTFKEIFSRGRDTVLSDSHYNLILECRPILEMFQERIIFHSGTLNAKKFDELCLKDLALFGKFEGDTYIPNNPKQIIGIVIDHMSLIRGVDKKSEMDAVSNHCVSFRNKCKIVSPILVMQLNRNSYGQERIKQDKQEPDESDLKDSGTMLEDVECALLLYNPVKHSKSQHRGYNIKELGNNYRSLKCVKSRFGTSDIAVGLGFYGDIGVFKELPPSDKINDYEKYKTPDWTQTTDEKVEQKSHLIVTL